MLKHILTRIGTIVLIPLVLGILFGLGDYVDPTGGGIGKAIAILLWVLVSLVIIVGGLIFDIRNLSKEKQNNKKDASIVILSVFLFILLAIIIRGLR